MKEYKRLLILFITSILLIIIYLILISDNKGEIVSSNFKVQKLLKIENKDIYEIDVENNGEKLILKKQNDKWQVIKPENLKFDPLVLESFPESLINAKIDKKISVGSDSLTQYGLDNPVSIKVITKKESCVILIGKQTSTKEGYYSKIKGKEKVYTISNESAQAMLLSKNKLKDKNVLLLQDSKKMKNRKEDITSITFEKDDQKVFSAKKETGKWLTTFPSNSIVEEEKLDFLLEAIVRTVALDFIEENPKDLSKYGLENPKYSLEFSDLTGNKKLLIGNEKVPGKEFYGMVSGVNEVFTLDESGFDFLDKPSSTFIKNEN